MDRKKFDRKKLKKYRSRKQKRRKEREVGKKELMLSMEPLDRRKPSRKPMPEPISPTRKKQKQDQIVKQNLTQDYAYTGIPGAIAEPAGVTIPAPKKPKLALRGGGRAYGRNS